MPAFLSVKPPGTRLRAGDELAELETVKVTLSVLAPVGGEVLEVNPALAPTPEVVNQDPYGAGWLALIAPSGWEEDRGRLLDARAYLAVVEGRIAEEVGGR